MVSQISTISNIGDTNTLLIKYGNQLKPINVTENDDLPRIETKIYERFKFNSEEIKNLQVQWYDDDYKQFVDLDIETWPKYTKNQQHRNNKYDDGSDQHLKLVHKQWSQQHNNKEIYNNPTGVPSSFTNPFTIINKMPAYQTSGITDDRMGSQVEHMNQSIHTDWVLNGLSWLLPLIAVFAFLADGIWSNAAYDRHTTEQHNYAGLTSTLLILFYYLQYDVKISSSHPRLYLIYQSLMLIGMLTGDILFAYYYGHHKDDTLLMCVYIGFGIVDSTFIFIVGYLKYYRQYRVSMGISIHNLFHLMSRLEVLLIILIPIFTSYDVTSSNSIAFFILYEFFSHSYNNPDLLYSGPSRLSFWLLIIFATMAVLCKNFQFVYQHNTQQPFTALNNATTEGNNASEARNSKLEHGFDYASNIMELLAAMACYVLLLLQFYSKSDKQKKMQAENHETKIN